MSKKYFITHLPVKDSKETKPFITSPYGERTLDGKMQFHHGVDLIVSTNRNHLTSKVACCFQEAVIVYAGHLGTAGNLIILLDIDSSTKEKRIVACYAHLNKIYDQVGDIVSGGEVIGYMGGSGATPKQYAPHLHFGLNMLDKDIHITKAISGIGSLDPMRHGLSKFTFAKS
ncbi:MAG: hypothetical protein IEMM0008_1636 [bacterium]|nr:MAG: hypothetical protein IEMM0008_1636 [bacterium]